MSFIPYHLEELEAALSSPNDGRNRPILRDTDRVILDIGCGIGQSFIAWGNEPAVRTLRDPPGEPKEGVWQRTTISTFDRRFVGMDVDEDAIREGMARAPWAQLLLQGAEHIPYPDGTFDLVMSRVSLPYCNIPKVLREVRRTLKPGGKVWFTLHSHEHAENCMRRSLYSLPRKMGVRLNGWLLQRFGFVVPVRGRYESWQDPHSFLALMARCGFEAEAEVRKSAAGDDEFRVTGVKR